MAKAQKLKCAIYTRKSTEEGLDQAFNSLDAQYAACAAYIESQRQEGWELSTERYDDGGYSGGDLERPGMRRLLADTAAGQIDVIVVYKVDRLTRSLFDFAKIVAQLERHKTSFVSITQSFNTTSSMGRLTLHILLSFAQFEREVITERVKDKVAASKRRGIWMGGAPPLGYDSARGALVINEAAAEKVREIMRLYCSLKNGRLLLQELKERRLYTRKTGERGGGPFTRGALFYLLKNRTYVGEVRHHGQWYPGIHQPIVPSALFDEVQQLIATNAVNGDQEGSHKKLSWLAGKVVDHRGNPMRTDRTSKGGRIYRYYASAVKGSDRRRLRVPAFDLEEAVRQAIAALLADELRLAALIGTNDIVALDAALVRARALELSTPALKKVVQRVAVERGSIQISMAVKSLGAALDVAFVPDEHVIAVPVTKVRYGKARRLLLSDPRSRTSLPKQELISLLSAAEKARQLVDQSSGLSLHEIARQEGRCASHLHRLYRVAHLSPMLKLAILEGRAPQSLGSRLLLNSDLAVEWTRQKQSLSFIC